jgi:Protein of unknown function (DUF4232)
LLNPRQSVAPVAGLTLATLLVGCGSGPQPASTSTGPPSSAPVPSSPSQVPLPAGQTGQCHTPDLRASVGNVSAASGARKVHIYLTNVSNHACTLEGYPGVQPAQPSGVVITYPVQQSQNPGRTLQQNQTVYQVTLRPSMTAQAVLYYFGQWITDADKKTCVTWSALAVAPPGEHDNLLIPNDDTACMAPFEIGPIQDG